MFLLIVEVEEGKQGVGEVKEGKPYPEDKYRCFLAPTVHLLFTLQCAYFFVVHCAKERCVVDTGGHLPPHIPNIGTLSILDCVAV